MYYQVKISYRICLWFRLRSTTACPERISQLRSVTDRTLSGVEVMLPIPHLIH